MLLILISPTFFIVRFFNYKQGLFFCLETHSVPHCVRIVAGDAGSGGSSAGAVRHLRAHVRRRVAQQRAHAAPQRHGRGGADAAGFGVFTRGGPRRQNGRDRRHLVPRLLDTLLCRPARRTLGAAAARARRTRRRTHQRRRHTIRLRLQVGVNFWLHVLVLLSAIFLCFNY